MRTTEEVRTYQGQMCGQCNTVTPHWRYERTNGGANPWQCKDCGSKFNPQMTLSELPAAMPPEPEPVDVQAASIAVPQPAEPLILTRQDHVAMMQMSLTGLHQIANALSFIEPDAFPVDELAEFAARCVKLSFHKFAKE